MEISLQGLIIAKHKFKENSVILTLFTHNKGILKGIYKGGLNKKNAHKIQIGNLLEGVWKARLEDHLGTFTLELTKSNFNLAFNNMAKLLAIKSICDLIYIFLPEHDNMPFLYKDTIDFLNSLELEEFFYYYIKWELSFLKHLGYGLDFSNCGVCNTEHDLQYVSPKTGVAVCEKVGFPYKNKLLLVPNFFKNLYDDSKISKEEKIQALKLTGNFINHLSLTYNKSIPYSREMLLKSLLT